ncbi:MAG: gamma-glutamyltransferase, partial [Deltaproteobacteria bacterium]|nr:gamma-glutamyltransferase [Deltaproteobacteria bacterium]
MRGVVAAGNPYTAEAAAELLRAGGNAIDAACAAAFATFVAEPLLASAGGAGLGTVAVRGEAPQVIDFFSSAPGLGGPAPKQAHFDPIDINFGSATQRFHVGRGSAAVPLALPGLAEAVRRFGYKSLAEVVAPAVRMARAGVPLSPEGAVVFELLWPIQSRDPATVALYSDDGFTPPAGRIMKNPELADTLEQYGHNGIFPKAARAALLEAFGPDNGGLLTDQDLAADVGIHVLDPLSVQIGEWEAFTSPRVGGRLVATILEELGDAPGTDEVADFSRFAAASRKAHHTRAALTAPGNTTHISVLDVDGGAAAITLTNGEG